MRKGFIKIAGVLYKERWEDLYIIFKDFRPTHIEFRHWENDMWYIYGENKFFDELKEGQPVPQYDVLMTRLKDGTLTFEFKKS